MLEQFLLNVYHPNRVVELMNSVNLIYRIGLTGFTDKIEEILKAETGIEPLTIASNIEASIADGLVGGLVQFGVDIEYEDAEIGNITDLLQFLAFWDTFEGSSPETYAGIEDIHELGGTNIDILIELFERAGWNSDARLIDWIVGVSDSLIARIAESFDKRPVISDEPSSVSLAALNDFRVFAVHYPDNKAVQFVKQGGAIGLDYSTLITMNGHWFEEFDQISLPQNLVGLALISNLSRENLKAELSGMLEPVLGSNLVGQQMLAEIGKILDKVISK